MGLSDLLLDDDSRPASAPDFSSLARNLTQAIGDYESRGQDPAKSYSTINSLQATGRYQFIPSTLAEDSQKYLGYQVSQSAFVKDPALQDKLAYLRTEDHLRSNYARDGNIESALRDTALDHIGRNGKLGIYARAHHNGKDVGESPNDYADEVLKKFSVYAGGNADTTYTAPRPKTGLSSLLGDDAPEPGSSQPRSMAEILADAPTVQQQQPYHLEGGGWGSGPAYPVSGEAPDRAPMSQLPSEFGTGFGKANMASEQPAPGQELINQNAVTHLDENGNIPSPTERDLLAVRDKEIAKAESDKIELARQMQALAYPGNKMPRIEGESEESVEGRQQTAALEASLLWAKTKDHLRNLNIPQASIDAIDAMRAKLASTGSIGEAAAGVLGGVEKEALPVAKAAQLILESSSPMAIVDALTGGSQAKNILTQAPNEEIRTKSGLEEKSEEAGAMVTGLAKLYVAGLAAPEASAGMQMVLAQLPTATTNVAKTAIEGGDIVQSAENEGVGLVGAYVTGKALGPATRLGEKFPLQKIGVGATQAATFAGLSAAEQSLQNEMSGKPGSDINWSEVGKQAVIGGAFGMLHKPMTDPELRASVGSTPVPRVIQEVAGDIPLTDDMLKPLRASGEITETTTTENIDPKIAEAIKNNEVTFHVINGLKESGNFGDAIDHVGKQLGLTEEQIGQIKAHPEITDYIPKAPSEADNETTISNAVQEEVNGQSTRQVTEPAPDAMGADRGISNEENPAQLQPALTQEEPAPEARPQNQIEGENQNAITTGTERGDVDNRTSLGPDVQENAGQARQEGREQTSDRNSAGSQAPQEVGNERVVVNTSDLKTHPSFQNRDTPYSEESVNRIVDQGWDWNKYNAIKAWREPGTGDLYTINHSRLEAADRLGIKTLPVDVIDTPSFDEAVELARNSNNLGTAETPVERAKMYRDMRAGGASESDITKAADQYEGKNSLTIRSLSQLDPDSVALQNLRLKGSDADTYRTLEEAAEWTGKVQAAFPEFNRQRQNEVYHYLLDNRDDFRGINSFKDFVQRAYDVASVDGGFDPEKSLHLNKAKDIHPEEIAFSKRLNDSRKQYEAARKEYQDKKEEAIANGAGEDHPAVEAKKIVAQVAESQYRDLLNNQKNILAKIRAQSENLFGSEESSTTPKDVEAQPAASEAEAPDQGKGPGPAASELATSGTLKSVTVPGLSEFVAQDIAPKLGGMKNVIKNLATAISPRAFVEKGRLDSFMRLKGLRDFDYAKLSETGQIIRKLFDGMTNEENINFLDRYKTGQAQPNKNLQFVADLIKRLDAQDYEAVKQFAPNLKWIENHFRSIWKVIPGMPEGYGTSENIGYGRARPLEGTKGFLKHATLPDVSTGIARGGELITNNAWDLWQLGHEDTMQYVTAQRMMKEAKETNGLQFVKIGSYAPEGFVPINDNIAKLYFKDAEGNTVNGTWYAEQNFGRILNNYLSVDKWRQEGTLRGNIGKGLFFIKNHYTALELAASPFHAIFTTTVSMVNRLNTGFNRAYNLGIRDPKNFRLGEIAKGVGEMATFYAAPVISAREGAIAKAYITSKFTSPEALAIRESQKADMNSLSRSFSDWRDMAKAHGIEKFESKYGKEHAEEFLQTLFSGGIKLRDADYSLAGRESFNHAVATGNIPGAAIRLPFMLNTMLQHPLFNEYIPNLKLAGAMRDFSLSKLEFANELAEGKMSETELARKAWDRQENVLGEMNFDNLFWDKTFKSGMQLAFRSVTWKGGTARQALTGLTGQFRDFVNYINNPDELRSGKLPRLNPDFTWLVSMSFMTAAMSSVTQKALTGTYPWETDTPFKDLVYPRVDADGNRFSPMTYVRDFIGAGKSTVDTFKKTGVPVPWDYLTHSTSGIYGKTIEAFQNKDFFNTEIYAPDDDEFSKMLSRLEYIAPKDRKSVV